MTDTLTPLLIDAKKEYLSRLSELICPFVLRFMDATYTAAVNEVGERRGLIEFQNKLRAIPSWNSSIIRAYTQAIETKFPYLGNLVAAVFVTNVKVLSSIKISSQRPNIKLKLPSNDAFIHQVYSASAKLFYENPFVVCGQVQADKIALVYTAIESAVRSLLPLGDVLSAYLSSTVNDDQTVNPIMSPVQSEDEEEEVFEDDNDADEEDFSEKVIAFPEAPPTYQPPPPCALPPPPPPPVPPQQQEPFQPSPPPLPQQQFPSVSKPPLFHDAEDGDHQFR